jgi:MFS family permease
MMKHTLSNRTAYWLSAGVIGLGLYASLTPSPLYGAYSVLWHFSPLTLTLIYATYAFGVLATLLLAGSLSDQVGRRPVLLASLAGLAGATVLFLSADSAAWLFVARGLQGVATGGAISAASASLLDLHPRRDAGSVALTNSISATTGVGLGMLISSALVQIGWEPLRLPFIVLLALIAVAFAGVIVMPEPVQQRRGLRLKVERPHVPAVVRRPFLLAALAVLSAWSIGALFFSLGPELGAQLFHSSDAVVAGIGVVALSAAACVSQLLTGRSAPWLATSLGSLALSTGIVLIALAAATGSTAAYLVGSLLGGVGFGATFLGGLRALVVKIPAEHRAAVLSAFFVAAYGSLSLPAIGAGVALSYISLERTFEIFGIAVAAIGLVVAALAWRDRPAASLHRINAAPLEEAA